MFLFSNSFGFTHYSSPKIESLKEKIAKEFYLLGMGWGFFDDNLFAMSHGLRNLKEQKFFIRDHVVPDEFSNLPVCVIGNGPSLDSAIDFLKNNQEKCLIIACGTALSSLYKQKIIPDIYVATERVSVVPDSLRLMDKDYLNQILFISTDVIHPDCHDFFERSILTLKADEALFALLSTNTLIPRKVMSVSHVNPLVGNIGLSIPLHLGFKRVYLFGMDNGFKYDEYHHSKSSIYYNDDGKAKNEFTGMVLAQHENVVVGNFGGSVKSNKLFLSSVQMMETLLKSFTDAYCFNCSDGVKIKGAEPQQIEDIDFSFLNVPDKVRLLEHLYNNMASNVELQEDDISESYDIPYFEFLIDKMKDEWRDLPSTRFELIQMMQRQTDYLRIISGTKQRHISFVLSGTLNTLYSMVSVFAYGLQYQERAIELVKMQVPLITEFMDVMKDAYRKGFNYIQGQHF